MGGLLNFLKLVAGEKATRYDPYLKQIQDKIAELKDNMQWRMSYMQEYNAIAVQRKSGRNRTGYCPRQSGRLKAR